VYVVGEVPSVEGYYVPSVLARSTYYGRPLDIRPTLTDHLETKKYIFPMLEKVTKEFGVALIYPHKALCDERACELSKYGYPLYVDDNHLSTFGAELIADTFLSIFDEQSCSGIARASSYCTVSYDDGIIRGSNQASFSWSLTILPTIIVTRWAKPL
jgi:hypothetical protein